jgi:hypothetical protein
MREIQILAAAEYLPDAAPAAVSLLVENNDNGDKSRTRTITQASSNSSAAEQATSNSSDAVFEALAQALSQYMNLVTLSMLLDESPLTVPSPQKHEVERQRLGHYQRHNWMLLRLL